MKLLASVFLLLALGYPATAEVVQSFTGKCDNFFFMGQPPMRPSGSQYKMICQKKTQAAGYEFATLYDTSRRIPVYSAYEFQETGSCTRKKAWDIEPQLDDETAGPLMAAEGTLRTELKGKKQALSGDYSNSSYDKGHLVPVKHRDSQSCSDATFTLTNAAPQQLSFNRGKWRAKEREVAVKLKRDCLSRGFHAYIVTGVVPRNESINGRVNVPSYFWSAYCCVDNSNKPQFSNASYGLNVKSSNKVSVSIADLDTKLKRDYGTAFKVFSNECQS